MYPVFEVEQLQRQSISVSVFFRHTSRRLFVSVSIPITRTKRHPSRRRASSHACCAATNEADMRPDSLHDFPESSEYSTLRLTGMEKPVVNRKTVQNNNRIKVFFILFAPLYKCLVPLIFHTW